MVPSPEKIERSIDVAAHAGAGRLIQTLAVCSPPSPRPGVALLGARVGLRNALGVGQYRNWKIHQIDPDTGAILRTIESNRFVTGVIWVDGELWHATWEGDESDLRRIDPQTGEVL
jgi:hypothetical protein